MPRFRPPSRIEPVRFPVFDISWFIPHPGQGRHILAYCGGGGSARTGVNNAIVIVQDGQTPEEHEEMNIFLPNPIQTGESAASALKIYVDPTSRALGMMVALSNRVQRYRLPTCEVDGSVTIPNVPDPSVPDGRPDLVNAIAVNVMADLVAVGCESGLIHVYVMSDADFPHAPSEPSPASSSSSFPPVETRPLFTCLGHSRAVCALDFSRHNGLLLSSAKDGTARVWNCKQQGRAIDHLVCLVQEDGVPAAPPPRNPINRRGRAAAINQPALVRGCAFGADLSGRVVVTVASARRGKAFLARWEFAQDQNKYICMQRTVINPNPVTAMSISEDATMLAMGTLEGSVVLWSIQAWKAIYTWTDVHELPVTCVAIRPFLDAQLMPDEEEDGVCIHVRSASGDGRFACLTMQRRSPKQSKGPRTAAEWATEHRLREYRKATSSSSSSLSILIRLYRFVQCGIMVLVLWPVMQEARDKCHAEWDRRAVAGWHPIQECLWQDVLWAPPYRPGVKIPPF